MEEVVSNAGIGRTYCAILSVKQSSESFLHQALVGCNGARKSRAQDEFFQYLGYNCFFVSSQLQLGRVCEMKS